MNGFKYNGVHSRDMKVTYIPDAAERGDFYSEYDTLDMDRSWSAGGEHFHTRVKTRVFNLSCYYSEITIEQREAILRWLDRRTSGELIFDDRPYAVQNVRPTKRVEFKDYLQRDNLMDVDLYSGTFTITFSAYEPFAFLNESVATNHTNRRALAETGLLPEEYMPASPSPELLSDFLIYNPGTEDGHTLIRFSGSVGSSDLIIHNTTTGNRCVLKSGLSVGEDEYIEIDSKTGRFELVSGETRKLYFAFHDEGQIKLAPCTPFYRNVRVNQTAGSESITAAKGSFNQGMVGQYIQLDGDWKYISDCDSSSEITVTPPVDESYTGRRTSIATMNYIKITKAADASVSRFEMICKAEVR